MSTYKKIDDDVTLVPVAAAVVVAKKAPAPKPVATKSPDQMHGIINDR